MTYGIDVSHHQNPSKLPWSSFRGKVDFLMARATYGTMPDKFTRSHITQGRSIGAKVGLYHFYRPTQPWAEQLEVFTRIVEQVCQVGDICPAVDIEKDPFPAPGHPVDSTWSEPCRLFTDNLVHRFGDAIVYITQREWRSLGSVNWVLNRPLWVAHYTSNPQPATPGNVVPYIWQHRVAPFVHNGTGGYDKNHPDLDQNRGIKPLPLIKRITSPLLEDFDHELDKGILQCFDYTPLDSEG